MAILKDIVATAAAASNSTKKDTDYIARAVLEAIKSTLAQGEDVTITGFGVFRVTDTEARTGRNPATGEELQIEASKRVSFRPSKLLKTAVKGL